MAYRVSFNFTTSTELTDFTVRCGNFTQTFYYPFDDSSCVIPDSENESDCDQGFSLDLGESLDQHTYTISINQRLPTSGDKFVISDIYVSSTGYEEIDCASLETAGEMTPLPAPPTPVWIQPVSEVYITNNTYRNNINIISVNLHNIPFVSNSMYYAFVNCNSLSSVSNINNSVTNMSYTFYNCPNLSVTPTIPNGVTNIYSTFQKCSRLENAPTIPNSVTDMTTTFENCSNLINAPSIPNGVTSLWGTFANCSSLVNAPDMSNLYNVPNLVSTFANCYVLSNLPSFPPNISKLDYTFAFCYGLTNIPTLPNSLTNITTAFSSCNNLENFPSIPNSVTNMSWTFSGCRSLKNLSDLPTSVTDMSASFILCTNLVNIPEIPNTVTNMSRTFSQCSKINGDIYIRSEIISNATDCFWGTSIVKNIYIPFQYENGVNTLTYNSFIRAGYKTDGSVNGVYLIDWNPS